MLFNQVIKTISTTELQGVRDGLLLIERPIDRTTGYYTGYDQGVLMRVKMLELSPDNLFKFVTHISEITKVPAPNTDNNTVCNDNQ